MAKIDLRFLTQVIPIHAEEGPFREVVPESALLGTTDSPDSKENRLGVIQILRRIFESLCLLDLNELSANNWAFISFPAYLMGKSIVETISTPDQTLFDVGYWQQGTHLSDRIIDAQRELISSLETRRVQFHPTNNAAPIRKVFVAWGVIRVGSDFLLVHREDRSRLDVKNFVFPGGRFDLFDLPKSDRKSESLRVIQDGKSELVLCNIENTLTRELDEELRLRKNIDYLASIHHVLKPYQKIEGAKNNHAFSEYHITLFNISLTPEGESRLLDEISHVDTLEWFHLDDLVNQLGRSDGKVAFIDALRDEFGITLLEFLDAIPDSSGNPYRLTGDSNAIDIPSTINDASFRVGRTGHEKDIAISLEQAELAMLWTFVAHARGMRLQPDVSHLALLGGAWGKLLSLAAINAARSLVIKLSNAKLPLLQLVGDTYMRVAIDPSISYFSEDAFTFFLDGQELNISLNPIVAPWAICETIKKSIELNPALTILVRNIGRDGRMWKEEKEISTKDIAKEIREKIDPHLRSIGLRKLIRTSMDDYIIRVPVGDRSRHSGNSPPTE